MRITHISFQKSQIQTVSFPPPAMYIWGSKAPKADGRMRSVLNRPCTKKAMVHSAVAFVFILSFISRIEAFPNGAPQSVCASMTPGHGVATQQSSSPFVTTTPNGVTLLAFGSIVFEKFHWPPLFKEIALPGSPVQLELRPQNGDTAFRGT